MSVLSWILLFSLRYFLYFPNTSGMNSASVLQNVTHTFSILHTYIKKKINHSGSEPVFHHFILKYLFHYYFLSKQFFSFETFLL